MKRRVLSLLRRGLITISEAAMIAAVDKSTASRWCDAARIDAGAARLAKVMEMRRAADRIARGDGVRDDVEIERHPRTGPSKATLRKQAEWAMTSQDMQERGDDDRMAAEHSSIR